MKMTFLGKYRLKIQQTKLNYLHGNVVGEWVLVVRMRLDIIFVFCCRHGRHFAPILKLFLPCHIHLIRRRIPAATATEKTIQTNYLIYQTLLFIS